MAEVQIDPRIYGGNDVTAREASATNGVEAFPVAEPTRTALPEGTAGRAADAEGAAALAEAQRPRAGLWDTTKAAAAEWTTTHLIDRAAAPSFTPDPSFKAGSMLADSLKQFTLEEEQFLLKSRSNDEYQYRYDTIEQQRQNRKLMGDNPVMAGIVSMGDPVYFAIDVASLGAGRLVSAGRAGRVVAGVTATTATAGIGAIEGEQVPVSTSEILTNAMLNGAITSLVFNPRLGRLEARDPTLPKGELEAAAHGLQPQAAKAPVSKWEPKLDEAGQPVLGRNGKPVYVRRADEVVSGNSVEAAAAKQLADETAAFHPAPPRDFTAASGKVYKNFSTGDVMRHITQRGDDLARPLAQHLLDRAQPALDNLNVYVLSPEDLKATGKREHYSVKDHAVFIAQTSSPEVMLHEVAHGLTVAKLRAGLENPGSAHAAIREELDSIRKAALPRAAELGGDAKYLTQNVEEFVAGLFTGKSNFTDMLAKMPDPKGGKNLLSKAVDIVRRALGLSKPEGTALLRAMKLADDLLDTAEVANRYAGSFQAPAQAAVNKVDQMAKRTGDTLAWNLHKSLAHYDRRVADLLVDDPVNMTADSAVSQKQAIRNGLSTAQRLYEDKLLQTMSERGAGVRQRILQPQSALRVQQQIEREVALEMYAREQAQRVGSTANTQAAPEIKQMADHLDQLAREALDEMKRAGVQGADAVEFRDGYFSRRWDSGKLQTIVTRLTDSGITEAAAYSRINRMVAGAVRRANGWTQELAEDVGQAIVDRARRKGEFTDAAFRAHVGNEGLAEVLDILKGSGIRGARLDRAVEVLTGRVDEAGKTPALKHRIDMDMRSSMPMPDGTTVSLVDLLDTNISNITDRYLDTVSGQAALARKGLRNPTEIGALRTEFLDTVPMNERAAAVELFDNSINFLLGRPVGADMQAGMRKLQAVTQMVGLASSGLWQVTEYATAMGKYGLIRATRHALANMPGFRNLIPEVAANRNVAESLRNVLARQSSQDIRLRPFVQRMEDNFEFPISDQVMLGLTQAKQLVPFLNAMKYVHHHQAQMVADLVVDTVVRGSRGEQQALDALAQYGLESHIIGNLRAEIAQHGTDIARWSDATWDAVRGPIGKMMDESVLRNRTGEIPAFAQFSPVGKFIFTFRSFVLGAHNKLLAGGLARNGFQGVGLVALYQFPLAMAAVAADSAIKGKSDDLTPEKLAARAVSQMGVMGLFSDAWGAVSGQKQQFGAPGLIAVDRAFSLAGNVGQGQWGQAANDLINAVPLLPLIPGVKAMGETFKE